MRVAASLLALCLSTGCNLLADFDVTHPPCDGGSDEPTCETDGLICDDGSIWECSQGVAARVRSCPLGCDQEPMKCYVPSNVPHEFYDDVGDDLGDLLLDDVEQPVRIDTDTGMIKGSRFVRNPSEGLDSTTGTYFEHSSQGFEEPGLGIFLVNDLVVDGGVSVEVSGNSALVIVAAGQVLIKGTILAVGDEQEPGPGGYRGGDVEDDGAGPCGGGRGGGGFYDTGICMSGGGGGGHGGAGGDGGDSTCSPPNRFPGGAGGTGDCGTGELVPLVGGNGGGGGGVREGDYDTSPGAGGGGGGAIQISARDRIEIIATGGINAGGGGGGGATSAGGGGGGSGGAILLESSSIIVASGAVIAANGGGGGGGDCN